MIGLIAKTISFLKRMIFCHIGYESDLWEAKVYDVCNEFTLVFSSDKGKIILLSNGTQG